MRAVLRKSNVVRALRTQESQLGGVRRLNVHEYVSSGGWLEGTETAFAMRFIKIGTLI